MDVGIVGAGPAGAFAALKLARAGHSATLYDPSHPREKPCGGGVPAGALRRHPELAEVVKGIGRPHHHVELWSPHGRPVRAELPEPLWVVPRRSLDLALVEAALGAGAQMRQERVRSVCVEAGVARITTDREQVAHDFVVGADGAASVVRRSLLGEKPAGPGCCATAGFHVQGLAEAPLLVEFLPDLPGYVWVFPRWDHASVGILCPAGRLGGGALRARVLEFLERRYPGSHALPRRAYGAAIPCPTPRHAARGAIGGPHFALLGDAAGQVDAVTGEGIEHAWTSAALLARALDGVSAREAASIYTRQWRRATGRDLFLAARWARRWYHPLGVEICLAVARHSPTAQRILVDLLMMVQPYATLRRRVLRDAWRRLTAGSPA